MEPFCNYPSKETGVDDDGEPRSHVVCTTASLFPILISPSRTQPAQAFSPLSAELPRRQPSVLTVKAAADVWPGNSYRSPSPCDHRNPRCPIFHSGGITNLTLQPQHCPKCPPLSSLSNSETDGSLSPSRLIFIAIMVQFGLIPHHYI